MFSARDGYAVKSVVVAYIAPLTVVVPSYSVNEPKVSFEIITQSRIPYPERSILNPPKLAACALKDGPVVVAIPEI